MSAIRASEAKYGEFMFYLIFTFVMFLLKSAYMF